MSDHHISTVDTVLLFQAFNKLIGLQQTFKLYIALKTLAHWQMICLYVTAMQNLKNDYSPWINRRFFCTIPFHQLWHVMQCQYLPPHPRACYRHTVL